MNKESNINSRLTENNPLRIIDIGASGGIHERWIKKDLVFEAVLFEPDPHAFDLLRAKIPDNYTVLPNVLSDTQKSLVFNLCRKRTCSSIYQSNVERLQLFPESERYEVIEKIELQAHPLDDVLSANQVNEVDFIKIDAEASELKILEGSSDALSKTVGLEIETSFFPIRKGQPLFHDVNRHMTTHGYELYDIRCDYWKRDIPLSHETVTKGQLIWGDGLYFKSPEYVVTHFKSAKKIRRTIAIYLAYGYYDLAMSLCDLAVAKGLLDVSFRRELHEYLLSKSSKMPSFRGRGVIQRIIKYFSERFSSTCWNTSSSQKLGN